MTGHFQYFLSKYQCGFRKGFSAQHWLLKMLEKWKSAIDNRKMFGALLTDLSRAFDCLSHDLLIAKLNAYRFCIAALKADSRLREPNDFLMFWSYFLLKKENYPIYAFVHSLFSTKKSPKVFNLSLTDETLCLSFGCHKQDKWIFQFSKLSWGSYVFL